MNGWCCIRFILHANFPSDVHMLDQVSLSPHSLFSNEKKQYEIEPVKVIEDISLAITAELWG